MKKRMALVGIGQAGGNVIVSAERRGFITGAMNTSPEDLYSEALSIVKNKLLLGKNGGCGKDRNIAKNDVKAYHQDIVGFIKTNILEPNPEVELVYITFSSSGGTGSGMGPIIIDMLRKFFPRVTFGAIVITPSNDESPIAIFNSRKCLEELYRLNIPVILPDNDKIKGASTRNALYNRVNDDVIQSLEDVCKERPSSNISNMDNKDKLKLLKTPGVTVIATSQVMPLDLKDENTLAKSIQQSWDNSVFVNLDYDKIVKRVGFIFEVSDKITGLINHNTINRDLGLPLEIFEGIYKADKEQRIISILTGLSFPENKIKAIDETLNKVQGLMNREEKKSSLFNSSEMGSLFEESTSLFGSPFDTEEPKDESVNLESLFSNY